MPRAPKACGRAGCTSRVVGRTYCDEHRPQTWTSHPSANALALTSADRARFRARVLRRDAVCRWPGCSEPATEADHVVAIALGGDPHDADHNGQGLCPPHHALKTRLDRAASR